jgi:hypothetical protein
LRPARLPIPPSGQESNASPFLRCKDMHIFFQIKEIEDFFNKKIIITIVSTL